jgi:hypothetical protein
MKRRLKHDPDRQKQTFILKQECKDTDKNEPHGITGFLKYRAVT